MGCMDIPFEHETVQLKPGDCLVFFSDGITEAWNKKQEEYGEETLIGILGKTARQSARDMLYAVLADVKRHAGRAPQSDDLTCGVVKVL